MRIRSTFISALLTLAAAAIVTGCGDGSSEDIFLDGTPTATPVNARTATPHPGATPTATETAVAGATPTETVAGPTATATPVAGGCNAGDQVTVVASLDKTYGAAIIDVGYPASLNIPGTGTAQSVADRVHFANSGLTTVNDKDQNADTVDDTLTASFVSFADQAPGTFVTITFDCVAGQAPPTASALTCTVVSASTGGGVGITDEQCSLNVTGP